MFVEVDPSDARPVYRQIVDEVQRQIALGIVKPDEPLPAVRQLAADLKINPNTVQHAYRELLREGTVYVSRGRGTFVAPVKSPKGELSRQRQGSAARQIAQRALRDAYRHGLVASDLIAALRELSAARHE